MDATVLLFLTSGLFLGWSLGANDAANVFGTAVGTRMVRFATAALVCSVFVVLGAVISGAGAAQTLGRLGSVNALAGAFMVALSAAFTIYLMTARGLTVSTSQAVVGAIIGWNLYSDSFTDTGTLAQIVSTWVASPVLAAVIAVGLFKLIERTLRSAKLHLLRQDAYTRLGLIFAGAFGAYSLGANNIANVMGVFVPESPFTDFTVGGFFTLSSVEQLFMLGALAIGVGVFTYSKKVMLTVGRELLPMSPLAAWVAVTAHSIVLFLFASEGLEHMLARAGLPTLPLVPVSSSQAVIGAVIGIGLMRGGREIRWRLLGSIAMGWAMTPVLAALLCFVALFFLQNVFNQDVYRPVRYEVSAPLAGKLIDDVAFADALDDLQGREFKTAGAFLSALGERLALSNAEKRQALYYGEVADIVIDPQRIATLDRRWLSEAQIGAIRSVTGRRFRFQWQLAEALAQESAEWRPRERTKLNKLYNEALESKLDYVYRVFTATL